VTFYIAVHNHATTRSARPRRWGCGWRCQTCPVCPGWQWSREPAGWASRGGEEAQKLGDGACRIRQRVPGAALGGAAIRSESIPGQAQLWAGPGAFLALIPQLSPRRCSFFHPGPCWWRSSPDASDVPGSSGEERCTRSQILFVIVI